MIAGMSTTLSDSMHLPAEISEAGTDCAKPPENMSAHVFGAGLLFP